MVGPSITPTGETFTRIWSAPRSPGAELRRGTDYPGRGGHRQRRPACLSYCRQRQTRISGREALSSIADEHPVVKLLGTIELIGRARRHRERCSVECWLLENPGGTAMMMSVTDGDGTRRSNMSRCAWLGGRPAPIFRTPTGAHPARRITSDWERFKRSSAASESGTNASLVRPRTARGAPLADAAPGQCVGRQLRRDVIATISDIAVRLPALKPAPGLGRAIEGIGCGRRMNSSPQQISSLTAGRRRLADRLVMQRPADAPRHSGEP